MRNGQPQRTTVLVRAGDPVSRAGVESQLRFRPDIEVVGDQSSNRAKVAVVVGDLPDAQVVTAVRQVRRELGARVVLLVSSIDDLGLLEAIEAGVIAILRRTEATGERLAAPVQAAASGDGSVPPDLLGRLFGQLGEARRNSAGLHTAARACLTRREIDVLRLLADGLTVGEITQQLAYSERTIKTAIHDLVIRLQLRNRAHAVAYAVRSGII